jgi:uncharacterized protein
VAGVTLGAYLQSEALSALADSWLPVLLICAATLGLCLIGGAILARTTALDPPTAALGMIAGGASGIVGMSGDLGADDRLVAFMQYLRVLLIVLLTPILVAIAFPGEAAHVTAAAEPVLGDARGWLSLLTISAVGAALAATVRFPGASLLAPMTLAAVLTLAVPGGEFEVPPLARELAFAVIGLQVGLKFTVETIRLLGRLLLPVVVAVLGVLAACAVLALVLDVASDVSFRDAYLATTPGGLYAVLAVALGANANAGFILAAQGLRLIVMVALAPVAVRWMVGRAGSGPQPDELPP